MNTFLTQFDTVPCQVFLTQFDMVPYHFAELLLELYLLLSQFLDSLDVVLVRVGGHLKKGNVGILLTDGGYNSFLSVTHTMLNIPVTNMF